MTDSLGVSARPEGFASALTADEISTLRLRGSRLIRHPEAPTALPLTPLVVAGITRARRRPRQASSQGFCAGIPRYLIGPFEKQVAKLVAFLQSLPSGAKVMTADKRRELFEKLRE